MRNYARGDHRGAIGLTVGGSVGLGGGVLGGPDVLIKTP